MNTESVFTSGRGGSLPAVEPVGRVYFYFRLLTGSQNMAMLKTVMLQRVTAFLHRKLSP